MAEIKLRDLDKNLLNQIKRTRESYRIKTNSGAAEKMIREFWGLKSAYTEAENKIEALEERIAALTKLLSNLSRIENDRVKLYQDMADFFKTVDQQ